MIKRKYLGKKLLIETLEDILSDSEKIEKYSRKSIPNINRTGSDLLAFKDPDLTHNVETDLIFWDGFHKDGLVCPYKGFDIPLKREQSIYKALETKEIFERLNVNQLVEPIIGTAQIGLVKNLDSPPSALCKIYHLSNKESSPVTGDVHTVNVAPGKYQYIPKYVYHSFHMEYGKMFLSMITSDYTEWSIDDVNIISNRWTDGELQNYKDDHENIEMTREQYVDKISMILSYL